LKVQTLLSLLLVVWLCNKTTKLNDFFNCCCCCCCWI
jgi:hypothetical protein